MSTRPSLIDRHTDATQRLILGAAVAVLERDGVGELTMRAVAKHAGISERTVFRYFASRDEFLDAVAAEVRGMLAAPAPPPRLAEVPPYVRVLYARFEETAPLVRAVLHSDIYDRMRETAGQKRWRAVRRLIDTEAAHRPDKERRIAAANVAYYLSATTWQYYRFRFRLPLEESVACAEAAVSQALEGLRAPSGK